MKTVVIFFSALLLFAAPAWAVLGQSVESVRSDRESLKGELRTIGLPGYSVHQIRRDDGIVVNEFVSPDGMVFGVSWQGPTLPNLAQLLGSHFQEFQRAARASHRRGPLVLRTTELVVESSGHMRAFQGRAYLIKAVPNNISTEVVR